MGAVIEHRDIGLAEQTRDGPERAAETTIEEHGIFASGELRVTIDRTYPLAEVAQAHQALTSRETTGKVLLIP